MTILSGLGLAVLFFFIFMPIFRMDSYTSDFKQINIRAADIFDGTVPPCSDCYNFTMYDALSSDTFMTSLIGGMSIVSINEEQIEDCKKRTIELQVEGFASPFFNSYFSS